MNFPQNTFQITAFKLILKVLNFQNMLLLESISKDNSSKYIYIIPM